jgi:hypothetical protein
LQERTGVRVRGQVVVCPGSVRRKTSSFVLPRGDFRLPIFDVGGWSAFLAILDLFLKPAAFPS